MEQKKTEGRKSTSDDNVPFCIEEILFSLAIHSVTFNLSVSTYFACIILHHSLKIKLDADPSDFWKER